MLIEIDDSIPGLPLNPLSRPVRALENLADSYLDGSHVLYSSATTANLLASREDLSYKAQAIYRKLQNDRTQNGRLLEKMPYMVKVIQGSSKFVNVNQKTDQSVVNVGIEHFYYPKSTLPTNLLCENLRDVELAIRIADLFAHRNKMPGIRIRANGVNGGGDTTAAVYEKHQAKDELILCVIDSDRKCPLGKRGDTAKKVFKKDDPSRPMSKVFELIVREMENLIPLEILRQALPNEQEKVLRIRAIEDIDHVAKHHIDLKDGTTLQGMFSTQNQPEKDFWLNGGSSVVPALAPSFVRNCLRQSACHNPAACTCIINEGLGPTLLSKVNTLLDSMGRKELDAALSDIDISIWTEVGSVIAAWCCGCEPRKI